MDRGSANLIPFGERGSAAPGDPANLAAEQALLGAIMITAGQCLPDVREIVTAEHFFESAHGRIFDAACALVDAGQRSTPALLKPQFEQDAALSDVGGADYLMSLARAAVSIASATDYARAIVDCALRRDIIAACQAIMARAHDAKVTDPAAAQLEAMAAWLDVLRGAMPVGGFIEYGQMLVEAALTAEALASGARSAGIKTGLKALDRYIGGWRGGKLYVLGGYPAMGKTGLALSFMAAAAVTPAPSLRVGVVFVSLEMDRIDVGYRELARGMGVDINVIADGRITSGQLARIFDDAYASAAVPVWIDDSSTVTWRQLCDRIRAMKRRHSNLKLAIVDFLQLIRSEERSNDSRASEIELGCYGLKALAKELDIAVLLLSQLRRLGKNEDPRPTIDRLRESGGIEAAADVVLLVHRPHYYQQTPPDDEKARADWERDKNITEIVIGKHRQGPVGSCRAHSDLASNRYRDTDDEAPTLGDGWEPV